MALDTIQFVDAIGASPTVALDLNVDGGFLTRVVSFVPGQLRYAMSENAMTDGINVSSSTYGAGYLTLELDLGTTTQDLNATAIQNLVRQLNKPTNLIKYQPNGATKPVFFETFRASMASIQDIMVAAARRYITLTLMTQSHALGLMETINVGTVNNDPAHATNGCYFDVTGVIGDVPAPCLIVDTVTANSDNRRIMGVRQHGTPGNATYFIQGESLTLGAGVTNPGGAADGVMSGSGTTNYVRTAGAGATDSVTWTLGGTDAARIAQRGTYRLFACVRITAANVFDVVVNGSTTVTIPDKLTAPRRIVDLGLVRLGDSIGTPGRLAVEAPTADAVISLEFNRTTGAGNLDLDYLQLVPADECQMAWTTASNAEDVVDGLLEATYTKEAGVSLYGGAANIGSLGVQSGGFPSLVPNQTNRFIWIRGSEPATDPADPANIGIGVTKGNTSSITVSYWPRYAFVRPSAT